MAESAQPDFNGSWKLDRSENFDKFIELMGENFNFIKRNMMKMAKLAKPVQSIKQEGDKFTIETKSTVRTTLLEFTVGTEFEREEEGNKLKGNASWDESKLVLNFSPVDPEAKVRKQKVTREIKDDELVMVITLGDDECICTRVFKKLPEQPAPQQPAPEQPAPEQPASQ